jgi:hypothetical protein
MSNYKKATDLISQMNIQGIQRIIKFSKSCALNAVFREPKHVIRFTDPRQFIDTTPRASHASDDGKRTVCGMATDKNWNKHTNRIVTCRRCSSLLEIRQRQIREQMRTEGSTE